jgi:hypothetical protein
MKQLHCLVAFVCLFVAVVFYFLINYLFIDDIILKVFMGEAKNELTNKTFVAWDKISVTADKLDYSSYAFGIVSLPIAAVSVYLSLASESLKKISADIFDKHAKTFGNKQELINFIKTPRMVKDDDHTSIDERKEELKLEAVHCFYSENTTEEQKKKARPLAFGKVLYLYEGRKEAIFIFIYTIVICLTYFSMPFLYYKKSELILSMLFFIYFSSILIFAITLFLYVKRNSIVYFWQESIPDWVRIVKNTKAALEKSEAKADTEILEAAIKGEK